MKSPSHRTTTLALLVAAGAIAHAAPATNGYYVEAFGGITTLDGGSVLQAGASTKGSYDRGFLAGAAFGRHLTASWSLEVEWFYRSNEIESMSGGAFDGVTDGDFASTNLMFNAVYTFGQGGNVSGAPQGLNTYIGLGLGFMQEVDIDLTVGGSQQEYSDNWVPSAQFIAGITYPVGARLVSFLELRYHYAGSPEMEAQSGGGGKVEADYSGVSGLIGLRYAF